MLKRIRRIRGVGLFRDADGSPLELRPLTLVYGENAAGKSTLSAVMRSLSTGDATILTERQSFNFSDGQYVDILDESGLEFTFENGSWSRTYPDVLVFDASFVESNVFSGVTIETNHRKSLLEFAIGSEAVAEKKAEAEAAQMAAAKREEVRETEGLLKPLREEMPLEDFLALPEFEDVDAAIQDLESKLGQSRRVETLRKRRRPVKLSEPTFDLGDLQNVLAVSLDAAHEEAAQRVRVRIERLHNHRAESWLATGLELADEDECPFCGQSIDGNKLVADYRRYFDAAYKRMHDDVARLPALVESLVHAANADTLLRDLEAAEPILALWSEDVELPDLSIEEDRLRAACDGLKDDLEAIAHEKVDEPTVAIHSERLSPVQEHIDAILSQIRAVNDILTTAGERIDEFLDGLESLDRDEIERSIRRRRLSKVRHADEVKELKSKLDDAREAVGDAEAKKDANRERARTRVNELLDTYCEEINRLLASFNASFNVAKIDHDYRAGGEPAVRYALSVRSEVLDMSQSEKLLRAVLSDGDKRTLAFAFFLAALKRGDWLESKVLVLDDPVTSFDKNRRRATIEIIDELRSEAEQIIVLAHDERFLLNVRDWAKTRDKNVHAREIKVHLNGDDSVVLANMSLDEECRSEYARDYQAVREYLDGTGSKREAKRALRPLLEGYLRRRFPMDVGGYDVLSKMVRSIEEAPPGSPLSAASREAERLRTLNTYTRDAHHGDRPDQGSDLEMSDTELRSDCEEVLEIIHRWGASG